MVFGITLQLQAFNGNSGGVKVYIDGSVTMVAVPLQLTPVQAQIQK